MSGTDEQAVAPAEDAVVNDGIIDLDAKPEAAEAEVVDGEEKPEGEAEAAKPEGEDDKPKKPSGAQRAKIKEQRLLSELSAAQQRIDELTRSAPAQTAGETDDKPPREEDFNGDYFAWQRALTAHEAGKAAREAIEKQFRNKEDSERSTKQAEIVRERAVAHAERVEDAREVIADFDKVMEAMKGVNVRQDVIDEIMQSDSSAVLTYHLAKHPDKLFAMNAMTPKELAREMGRLEATVQLPSPKKQTTAPTPFSAVKGGASPSSAEGDLSAWLKKTYG